MAIAVMGSQRAELIIAKGVREILAASQGQRNDAACRAAFRVGADFVFFSRGLGVRDEHVEAAREALVAAALEVGLLPSESRPVIGRALRAGVTKGRRRHG